MELGKKDEERGNGGNERRKDKGLREKGRERRGNAGGWKIWKRKRELEEEIKKGGEQKQREEEQIFQRSKKMPRLPGKKEGEGKEKIMEMMQVWMKEFKERWERIEINMEVIRRA